MDTNSSVSNTLYMPQLYSFLASECLTFVLVHFLIYTAFVHAIKFTFHPNWCSKSNQLWLFYSVFVSYLSSSPDWQSILHILLNLKTINRVNNSCIFVRIISLYYTLRVYHPIWTHLLVLFDVHRISLLLWFSLYFSSVVLLPLVSIRCISFPHHWC